MKVLSFILAILKKIKIYTKENSNDKKDIDVLEYSRKRSEELGIRSVSEKEVDFKRPIASVRKGSNPLIDKLENKAKFNNSKYVNALKRQIPLKELCILDEISNKTIRVFVDTIYGTNAIVRDNTAVCEMDVGGIYDIAGEFVLININKRNGKIKINYILKD